VPRWLNMPTTDPGPGVPLALPVPTVNEVVCVGSVWFCVTWLVPGMSLGCGSRPVAGKNVRNVLAEAVSVVTVRSTAVVPSGIPLGAPPGAFWAIVTTRAPSELLPSVVLRMRTGVAEQCTLATGVAATAEASAVLVRTKAKAPAINATTAATAIRNLFRYEKQHSELQS